MVGVVSAGRDETVEVRLLRRTPDARASFEEVGRVTTVAKPVRAAQPTVVSLAVAFSSVGEVDLKAVAAILCGRDASPHDNTALASIRVTD